MSTGKTSVNEELAQKAREHNLRRMLKQNIISLQQKVNNGSCDHIAPVEVDHERLKTAELVALMPNAWMNISFLITNAFEVVIGQLVDDRVAIHEIRNYARMNN